MPSWSPDSPSRSHLTLTRATRRRRRGGFIHRLRRAFGFGSQPTERAVRTSTGCKPVGPLPAVTVGPARLLGRSRTGERISYGGSTGMRRGVHTTAAVGVDLYVPGDHTGAWFVPVSLLTPSERAD